MKRVILNIAAAVGIAVLALCMSQPAGAAVVTIDFSTGGAGVGGTFTLNGSNASGLNIPIGDVTISGDPNATFDTTYAITGGLLNFNTASGSPNITISGAIAGLSIASETLLSGTITSFTANANGLQNASGPDTKAANFLTALGLPTTTTFQLFGFSLTTTGVLNANNSDTVVSTDIRNTSTPEPGTLVMFGSGLLGLAGIIRRKLKA